MDNKIAGIVAVLTLVGSAVGWLISIQTSLDKKLDSDVFYEQRLEVKNDLRSEMKELSQSLMSDIREIRQRFDEIQNCHTYRHDSNK